MEYQHKTISVSEKHAAFVKEESINLSRLVRKFLDEIIKEKNAKSVLVNETSRNVLPPSKKGEQCV